MHFYDLTIGVRPGPTTETVTTRGVHMAGTGKICVLASLAIFFTAAAALAGDRQPALRLPSIWSDGAVLQQQRPVKIWGLARPDAEVTVVLSKEGHATHLGVSTVKADVHGTWRIELESREASFERHTLEVRSGGETLSVGNLLFGEVWVSGGQSNMALETQFILGARSVLSAPALPNLRMFYQKTVSDSMRTSASQVPCFDVEQGRWRAATEPGNVRECSAIAYTFARSLYESLNRQGRHVPVGVINTAVGASSITQWISRDKIVAVPGLVAKYPKTWRASPELKGSQSSFFQPTALYNHKIAPLAPFGVRGVIWLQGESDAGWGEAGAATYRVAMTALIEDWRRAFEAENLPFLYLLLHPYAHTVKRTDPQRLDSLAFFREAQLDVAKEVPNAAVFPIHDVPLTWKEQGNPFAYKSPIHPLDKQPVGHRLSLAARALVYGEAVECHGPIFETAEQSGGGMRITFSHCAGGLAVRPGDHEIHGFTVCGSDRMFVPASARIDGDNTIVVWSESVPDPVAVAYGFTAMNQGANLVNGAGQPAPPFRSDRRASTFVRVFPDQEYRIVDDEIETGAAGLAAPQPAGPRAGDRPVAMVDEAPVRSALEVLVARGCIGSVEEWESDLAPGEKMDGARAGALLVKLSGLFTPAASLDEAVAELVARRIISSPAAWRERAVAGGTVSGKDVAAIVQRAVSQIWQPIPVPRSFAAEPLEPCDGAAVRDRYDVVIAGAGTGGCGTAIQAARMGSSVLLVEETDWVGGQAFAAGVTSMDEGKPFIRERGLYRELCGLIEAHYDPLGTDFLTAYWRRTPAVEPRVGQQLLLRMLGDARGSGTLDLLLRSRVMRVTKRGDTVVGVDIECAGALQPTVRAVGCTVLVDATEWGDVIPLTGARYRSGNCTSDAIDPEKRVQDITWTAVVKRYPDGVPPELRVATPPPGYDGFLTTFRKSLICGSLHVTAPPAKGQPWAWNWFIGYRGMPDSGGPDRPAAITRTHLNFNNDFHATVADLEDSTVRLETCRGALVKTLCLLHFIQTELGRPDWSVADDEGYDTPFNRTQVESLIDAQPSFAPYRSILRHFPVMPYVRESRRIIGVHTLTAREIERQPGSPVQFPDTVALGDYAVDLHGSMTPKYLEPDLDRTEDIPRSFGERGIGPFAIPLRSFIPEKVEGFLAAEKNISQSRLVNGATRLQPSTLNMGQAAGAIAALAARRGIRLRDVDAADVQDVLLDAGCPLAITPVTANRDSDAWKAEQRDAVRGCPTAATQPRPPQAADRFNYVFGTQTFGAAYQFSTETRLVETAKCIHGLGSTVIKFGLGKTYAGPRGNVPSRHAGVDSLASLARDEPSHRRVLDMPFCNFVLWANTFNDGTHAWKDGFSTAEATSEYREMYDLVAHLLTTYSGSGKTFYLGHWEGDGLLRTNVSTKNDSLVTPVAAQGMADWLSTRQRAVDDAKRETQHHDVAVWHYAEVNHVRLAMDEGRPAVVNRVLPHASVDFVSYSCYDTQNDPVTLQRALDFIESQLSPKPEIAGRRVFLGEYGFPTRRYTPAEQDARSRTVMRAAIEWGCPLVLYWALYNNEIGADGRQAGFWMIDDKGVKQPIYETHERFFLWARLHVSEVSRSRGRPPSQAEFAAAAVEFLRRMPAELH